MTSTAEIEPTSAPPTDAESDTPEVSSEPRSAVPKETMAPSPAGESDAPDAPTNSPDLKDAALAGRSSEPAGSTRPQSSVQLADLQAMTMAQLLVAVEEFQIKNFPPRTRHQLVCDLARAHLARGIGVWAEGVLEMPSDNPNVHGVLRWQRFNFAPCPEDATIPAALIREHSLRAGWKLSVTLRPGQGGGEKVLTAGQILTVEGTPIAAWRTPPHFDQLTPLFPDRRIVLESLKHGTVTSRAIDLVATLGRGQRGLILAPPRVGKTVMLKDIARAIRAGSPDLKLVLLLIDERPEEVTDFRRELDAATEIYSSTFDEPITRHAQVADLANERAKRLVEQGENVVLLLDSLTRLARGFNNTVTGKGRTMSGGLDAKALLKPKKFFGAARKTEEGGSLTILATCLMETGSRMDEVIFEEFKGTANMEIHLDRSLSDKRLFPAIHITQSGTRRDELLYHPDEFALVAALRKQLAQVPAIDAMETLQHNIMATGSNAELLLKGLRDI